MLHSIAGASTQSGADADRTFCHKRADEGRKDFAAEEPSLGLEYGALSAKLRELTKSLDNGDNNAKVVTFNGKLALRSFCLTGAFRTILRIDDLEIAVNHGRNNMSSLRRKHY